MNHRILFFIICSVFIFSSCGDDETGKPIFDDDNRKPIVIPAVDFVELPGTWIGGNTKENAPLEVFQFKENGEAFFTGAVGLWDCKSDSLLVLINNEDVSWGDVFIVTKLNSSVLEFKKDYIDAPTFRFEKKNGYSPIPEKIDDTKTLIGNYTGVITNSYNLYNSKSISENAVSGTKFNVQLCADGSVFWDNHKELKWVHHYNSLFLIDLNTITDKYIIASHSSDGIILSKYTYKDWGILYTETLLKHN
ncbi:hypothetical protein M2138_002062 [Dysgonomonadaceae bacterium PH5-43]|nr:hypothetical protein [Dysgonomonadaceae bacterium PH5-43]